MSYEQSKQLFNGIESILNMTEKTLDDVDPVFSLRDYSKVIKDGKYEWIERMAKVYIIDHINVLTKSIPYLDHKDKAGDRMITIDYTGEVDENDEELTIETNNAVCNLLEIMSRSIHYRQIMFTGFKITNVISSKVKEIYSRKLSTRFVVTVESCVVEGMEKRGVQSFKRGL